MNAIERGVSLTDQVRDYLLYRILDDDFDENVIYSVTDLSAQLKVSRTPVREAVLQLQELGMLKTVKNKGFTVVAVTNADILAAFQIRHVLEPIAARITARHAPGHPEVTEKLETYYNRMVEASKLKDQALYMENDILFHDVMIKTAENSHMVRALSEARDTTYRRGVFTRTPTRSWDVLNAEHERILRAVLDGDEGAAEECMRNHVRITGEYYLQRLGQSADSDWLRDY